MATAIVLKAVARVQTVIFTWGCSVNTCVRATCFSILHVAATAIANTILRVPTARVKPVGMSWTIAVAIR